MCHGSGIIWGYPYYFAWGGILGILFHLAILTLIVWAVVAVVKSLTSQKAEPTKNGGAK